MDILDIKKSLLPLDTTYDPATGVLTIEKSSHGFSNGDLIRIADGGIRFTCAKDSHGSNHDYPRATDPYSGKLLTVSNVTTNTFDVQVGLKLMMVLLVLIHLYLLLIIVFLK